MSGSEGAVQMPSGSWESAFQRKRFRAWSPERAVEITRVFQGSVTRNSGSGGLDTEYTSVY